MDRGFLQQHRARAENGGVREEDTSAMNVKLTFFCNVWLCAMYVYQSNQYSPFFSLPVVFFQSPSVRSRCIRPNHGPYLYLAGTEPG